MQNAFQMKYINFRNVRVLRHQKKKNKNGDNFLSQKFWLSIQLVTNILFQQRHKKIICGATLTSNVTKPK